MTSTQLKKAIATVIRDQALLVGGASESELRRQLLEDVEFRVKTQAYTGQYKLQRTAAQTALKRLRFKLNAGLVDAMVQYVNELEEGDPHRPFTLQAMQSELKNEDAKNVDNFVPLDTIQALSENRTFRQMVMRQVIDNEDLMYEFTDNEGPISEALQFASGVDLKFLSDSFTKILNRNLKKQKFRCEICGQGFTAKRNLLRHIREKHTQGQVHECQICGKKFKRKRDLEIHMISHNTEREMHRCSHPGCDKKFSYKHDLRRHERVHAFAGNENVFEKKFGRNVVQTAVQKRVVAAKQRQKRKELRKP